MKKQKKIILINLSTLALVVLAFYLGNWIKGDNDNYNWELVSLIVNNLTVIYLFIITFVLINSQTLKKEENKKNIAELLLNKTYSRCKENIDVLFASNEVVEKYILPKCDRSKPITAKENVIFTNLKNDPFIYEGQILNYADDGVLSFEEVEKYMDVKEKFTTYIDWRIIAYDAPHFYNGLERELEDLITNHKNHETQKKS